MTDKTKSDLYCLLGVLDGRIRCFDGLRRSDETKQELGRIRDELDRILSEIVVQERLARYAAHDRPADLTHEDFTRLASG